MAKAPKGLSIKRNSNNFVCSWNPGESGYDAQEFRYATKKIGSKYAKWIDCNVSKGAKNLTIKWNEGVELDSIKFEVRAKKNKKWSSWSEKEFNVKPPKTPSVRVSYDSNQSDARVVFSWSVKDDKDDPEWFNRVGWRTRLVDKNGDGSEPWGDTVYDTHNSYSFTQQDDSTVVFAPGASYERQFQLVAYGPGGKNPSKGFRAPKTAKYVYAKPNDPEEVSGSLIETDTGGYLCEVTWDSKQDNKHPIDSQEIQYIVTVPTIKTDEVDEEYYIDVPTGQISWTTAGTFYPSKKDSTFRNKKVKDVSKIKKKKKKRLKKTRFKTKTGKKITKKQDPGTSERFIFSIDQTLQPDYVVFVRAVSKRGHESLNTPSKADLCDDFDEIYSLSAPTGVVPSLSPIDQNRIRVDATNTCEISGSFLIVSFKAKGQENIEDIGVILDIDSGTKLIEIPNDVTEYSIGVRAAIGVIPEPTRNTEKEYDTYAFSDQENIFIQSETKWVEGTTVPSPPNKVELSHTDIGNIHVHFDWDWKEAQSAELSWSDYKDAWISTSEPSYFTIDNLYSGDWNIADLELGKTYHVRVRLKRIEGEVELVSRWSEIESIFLSSSPSTPRLDLSPSFINPGGSFTASWTYVSADDSPQDHAVLYLYDPDTKKTIGEPLGNTDTEQSIKIETENLGWQAGEKKQLVVIVGSEAGAESEFSPSEELEIVDPITCSVTYSNSESGGLVSTSNNTNAVDGETQETSEVTITNDRTLRSLPLTLNVTGAGDAGRTTVLIRREGAFNQPGPDENEFHGYDEEIVFSAGYDGETPLVITGNDARFSGSLDEGASYRVFAMVEDEHGQTAYNEDVTFIVDWNHDATMPYADLEYVTNSDGEIGAKITVRPLTSEIGDVLDIYRFSVDKPELILSGGDFTQSYIDPYPTIGDFGGYRIVYRTKYDDFLTSAGHPAWWDITADNMDALIQQGVDFVPYNVPYSIINFGNDEIHLSYDVNLASNWNKNFTETSYLGGSIQGDWCAGVKRSGSITANVVTNDLELIKSMRRLAVYNGVCQIRSYDGSNYKANIDVSENIDPKQLYGPNGELVRVMSYSLNISRVDSDSLDAVLYSNWDPPQNS